MKELCRSNDLIARDEGLHTQFAVLLFTNHINNKPSQDDVYEIFEEAVNIEDEFIDMNLPVDLLGINSRKMKTYVRFVADNLLSQFGYDKMYGEDACPFEFMENIGSEKKSNFFEILPTEYSNTVTEGGALMGLDAAAEGVALNYDEDF